MPTPARVRTNSSRKRAGSKKGNGRQFRRSDYVWPTTFTWANGTVQPATVDCNYGLKPNHSSRQVDIDLGFIPVVKPFHYSKTKVANAS